MKTILRRYPIAVPAAMAVAAVLFATGCERSSEPAGIVLHELASPAGTGSGEPNLVSDASGRGYMTWVEKTQDGATLRFSVYSDGGWSEARNIASGDDWFVNWADFPTLAVGSDGAMATHWLERSGPDTYAYDIKVVQSTDGGNTWSPPIVPHTDGTKTEHGFVSMVPWADGAVLMVWLDGRKTAKTGGGHGDGHGGGQAEMTLRGAILNADGSIAAESLLDERVCDCCQTSGVVTPRGAVFAYRDRSANELRDISVVAFRDGVWNKPRLVNADMWKIDGCPVNGPSLAAVGNHIAIAWFTRAGDRPQVNLAFSNDAGATFTKPIPVDNGNPLGRVDVAMLEDGTALVSWLESAGANAEIRVRRINGTRIEPSTVLVETSAERASGFPQLVRIGDDVLIAWTEAGEAPVIRTGLITF